MKEWLERLNVAYLTPNEFRLMVIIGLGGDGVCETVKSLAFTSRIGIKACRNTLNDLVAANLITAEQVPGKPTIYRLPEKDKPIGLITYETLLEQYGIEPPDTPINLGRGEQMNNTSTNLKQPESKATPNQADTPVNLGRGQNTPIKSGRGARVNSKKRLTEKVSENTPVMVEINRFFRRRPTTLWAVGDARKLEDINPAQEDIELLAEWFKADLTGYDGHNGKPFIPRQRTQLSTLLNHWDDELDKARANLPLLQGTTAGKPPRPPGTGWFWNGVDWVK